MASVRLTSGKGDFHIRKFPDGSLENACLCVHNADFSSGCLAQVHGKVLLDSVMGNNGCYTEETLVKFKKKGKIPDKRCGYCYAKRHNSGRAIPSEVDDVTIADFEKYKPEIVRLGKNTEVGYQLYRPQLVKFLELCKRPRFETKIIMPTKVLEFDPKLAKLFREVGGTVSYSVGYNGLEQGLGSQGFHNQWRIEQAEAYHKAGVNAALTVVCDVTASIDENAQRGSSIKLALNSSVPMRILPMKLISKGIAKVVTGHDWADLKTVEKWERLKKTGQLFLGDSEQYRPDVAERIQMAPYSQVGNNVLVANFYHSDFQEFMDKNSSCGRIGDIERCDNCLVYPASMNFSFHKEELVPVQYVGSRAPNGGDGRYNRRNNKDPNAGNQDSIFDEPHDGDERERILLIP